MKHIKIFILIILSNHVIAQWVQINTGIGNRYCYDIAFINENTAFVVAAGGILIKTTNAGINWETMNLGLTINDYPQSIQMISSNTGYIAGGNGFTIGGFVLKTTNGGLNWASILLDSMYKHSLFFVDANTGIVVGESGSIQKSTDGGLSFINIPSGNIDELLYVRFINQNTGFITGTIGRLMKTTNQGVNWSSQRVNPSIDISGIFFVDDNTGYVVLGDISGPPGLGAILKTTNSGLNWTAIFTLNSSTFKSVFFTNSNTGYVAGMEAPPGEARILITTNAGLNWQNQLPTYYKYVNTIKFINDTTGYVTCSEGYILKTTNGGGSIGIIKINNEIPQKFKLYQNYPNPFNPVTIINFDLNKATIVKLVIFDITGREISVLVDEKLNAGKYSVTWNAKDYSSGVYFYKILTEEYTESKKMILVK